jgi:origin recognition complex subunit 4
VSQIKRRKVSPPVVADNGMQLQSSSNIVDSSEDAIDLLSKPSQETASIRVTPQPPSFPAADSPTRPRREIMEGVIITTPRHLSNASNVQLGYNNSGTPSPSPWQFSNDRDSGLKTSHNASLSRDSPVDRSSRAQEQPLSSPPSNCADEGNHPLLSASPYKSTMTSPCPKSLPSHLISHFHAQKRTLLHALQNPPLVEYEKSPYYSAHDILTELLKGTIERREGNSCLILGTRGCGKTRVS